MGDSDTILWALVCAAYHLQMIDDEAPHQLEAIRALLADYSPESVSLHFLRARLAFNPPETLSQAQALYEHYGIDPSGHSKISPDNSSQ